MNSNVSAIVIAYYPDKDFIQQNIDELSKQVGKVFIINNTPEQELTLLRAEIINLYDNVGIAKAQNIGLKASIDQGFEYSILFDQDSFVPHGMINSFVKKINLYDEAKVASIGPRAFDILEGKKMTSKIMKETQYDNNLTSVKQIMASGQFIPLSVLAEVGFMDESLFIDAVDHEWCWRALSKGHIILVDDDIVMKHQLGDSRKKILGFTYQVGASIRLYYVFRNTLKLMFVSYVPAYWKLRNVFSLLFKFVIFSILGPERKKRIVFMVKGIMHSVLGNSGKYN